MDILLIKIKLNEILYYYTIIEQQKIWIGLSSIVIPLIAKKLNVDEESVSQIWWSLISMLAGVSLADFGKEAKKK